MVLAHRNSEIRRSTNSVGQTPLRERAERVVRAGQQSELIHERDNLGWRRFEHLAQTEVDRQLPLVTVTTDRDHAVDFLE
ncbi:MAG TPA: hypothetical protein PLZ93_00535 [Nocardioides sp.]|nr:hypothetical protein [Nocardioides sp.]HRI94079.1 hypothetical protein [Nocardioides sp.]HRK44114.1 hypothetical protein [Nocardioides sp.]